MSKEESGINTQSVSTASTTSNYRSIFKATSLFGGVQVYQILIGVVKSKFIAALLGPLGVGIQGLFYSALQFIQSLTALGLKSSAVRDVSEANGSGDITRVAEVIKTLRRLVWCTGLLGTVVVIAFSPVLSRTSFGDDEHIIPFICLSVTLLLDQICAGQKVVLQGMRRLRHLANASAIGSTASLFVSVPLYYLYGVKGIVPTLILNSLTLLMLSWFFARKVKLPSVDLSMRDTLKRGAVMLKMGLAMSWNGILVYGCSYVLRWFIRAETSTEAVGLFTAGFTIINSYVGMIFTAIGTDYYPRLAAVNEDNSKMKSVVNQQGEIAALILAPLLLICIVFMPIIIRILYSEEFLPAHDFIAIAAIGMMFKLGSWLIAYQFIAKGESKLFVLNETIANSYSLAVNLLGYKLWGLTGLGIAFTLTFVIYFTQVYLIANKRYGYKMTSAFRKMMLLQLILLVICYSISILKNPLMTYTIGGFVIVCSSFYSLKELESRIGVFEIIKKKLKIKG